MNMTTDLFQYNGTVKITLGSRVRTYKNNGTSALFRLFADCLVHPEEIGAGNVPQQIMLKGNNQGTIVDALYTPIKSLVKQVITTSGGGYGVKITVTLLPTNIMLTTLTNYQLILKDNFNTELASIDIEDALIPQISEGRQALIEWILEVSNKQED